MSTLKILYISANAPPFLRFSSQNVWRPKHRYTLDRFFEKVSILELNHTGIHVFVRDDREGMP